MDKRREDPYLLLRKHYATWNFLRMNVVTLHMSTFICIKKMSWKQQALRIWRFILLRKCKPTGIVQLGLSNCLKTRGSNSAFFVSCGRILLHLRRFLSFTGVARGLLTITALSRQERAPSFLINGGLPQVEAVVVYMSNVSSSSPSSSSCTEETQDDSCLSSSVDLSTLHLLTEGWWVPWCNAQLCRASIYSCMELRFFH